MKYLKLFKNDFLTGEAREFYVMAKNVGEESQIFEVIL